MRLPGVFLAARAEAGAFQAVAERVVDGAEEVVGEHALGGTVDVAEAPLDAGVLEQRVVLDVELGGSAAEAGLSREYGHALVGAQVAHGVPRVAAVGVGGRVHEPELVAGVDEGIVLRSRLADQVLVGLAHALILRRVRHGFVGRGDAARAVLVDFDVGGLALEFDAVVASVLLGDGDERRVGAGRSVDLRHAGERHQALVGVGVELVDLCLRQLRELKVGVLGQRLIGGIDLCLFHSRLAVQHCEAGGDLRQPRPGADDADQLLAGGPANELIALLARFVGDLAALHGSVGHP